MRQLLIDSKQKTIDAAKKQIISDNFRFFQRKEVNKKRSAMRKSCQRCCLPRASKMQLNYVERQKEQSMNECNTQSSEKN